MLYYIKYDTLSEDKLGASQSFLWAFYDDEEVCYHWGYCIDSSLGSFRLNKYYYFADASTTDPIEL